MSSPDPSSDAHSVDRRIEPRQAMDAPVTLVNPAGHAVAARMVDRSLSGLRLHAPEADALQGELTVLSPTTGAAYISRVVWRSAPFVGLAVLRTVEMRTATGASDAHLRQLWREHLGR